MTTAYDVHVMGSDGSELRCIRVPVTATSTIRQLATDCLSRFVMQSRFTTPNLDVVVDDVTAAGCSLFYNDPVAAVVRPTEVLAVHIRNVASTDVLPRRIAVHTNAAAAVEVSPADISVIKVSTAPTAAPAPLPSADLKRTRDQTPATEPAERQPRRTQPPPVPPVTIIPEPAAAVKAAKTKALGWGNASHKTYPQNYVADPEQMIRELRKQKAAQAKLAAEKKAAEKAAAAAEAANAPVLVDDITQKPMPGLAAVPTNTSIASLSKLELYCDADIQEMQRRPLVTHNVARQLTYA